MAENEAEPIDDSLAGNLKMLANIGVDKRDLAAIQTLETEARLDEFRKQLEYGIEQIEAKICEKIDRFDKVCTEQAAKVAKPIIEALETSIRAIPMSNYDVVSKRLTIEHCSSKSGTCWDTTVRIMFNNSPYGSLTIPIEVPLTDEAKALLDDIKELKSEKTKLDRKLVDVKRQLSQSTRIELLSRAKIALAIIGNDEGGRKLLESMGISPDPNTSFHNVHKMIGFEENGD